MCVLLRNYIRMRLSAARNHTHAASERASGAQTYARTRRATPLPVTLRTRARAHEVSEQAPFRQQSDKSSSSSASAIVVCAAAALGAARPKCSPSAAAAAAATATAPRDEFRRTRARTGSGFMGILLNDERVALRGAQLCARVPALDARRRLNLSTLRSTFWLRAMLLVA